jgi:hypothetical protein
MSHPNTYEPIDDAERARETAEARADMERRAEAEGVRPFDADEWRADLETDQTPDETRREVDDFLSMLREWRDTPATHRSIG